MDNTIRRKSALSSRFPLVGSGVSGGEEGARWSLCQVETQNLGGTKASLGSHREVVE